MLATLYYTVSPSFYLAKDEDIVSVSAYHVELMTFEETSFWVWTYCHLQGWDEAGRYAENFKEQEITGRVLRYLSDSDLKVSLKIISPSHRSQLLSAIRNLLQSATMEAKIDSEVQGSVSTLASPCRIVYPVYLVPYQGSIMNDNHNSFSTGVAMAQSLETSAFSTPVTWSSVGGWSGCEGSIPQYICPPTTICVPSYSDKATMLSQVPSFGTDLAKYAQTDMSDIVSESYNSKRSCGAECTDVYGHSMPSGDMVNSTLVVDERKTDDIDQPNKHVPQVTQMRRSKPASTKRRSFVNLKKLLLTLESDEIPKNGDTEIIRSWFVNVDSGVKVKPMNDVPNAYTIIFESEDSAIEALKFNKKGFKMKIKYPPRAGPKNPVEYKAPRDLKVRQGKSLNGNYLAGVIKMGETVMVNQIKGRRARVVNRGWLSANTESGIQLLKRLDDS